MQKYILADGRGGCNGRYFRVLIDEQNQVDEILVWYDDHRRVLPWRALPGDVIDPYKVWLSEIMLQQTVVKAVIPYFLKFTATWPTINDLAGADLDDILTAWAGLGYYARARNLYRCARAVAAQHEGRFPETFDSLLVLPGIGPYTAAAIAAIAFNEAIVPLDGNIERVTARYFAISDPLPGAKDHLRKLAQNFMSHTRAGDLAQALMDLGAGVCTPRNPSCSLCPLNGSCQAFQQGIAEQLPVKAARKVRPSRFATAFFVLREDGCLLLHRRAEKGLLGGMMEIPSSPWIEGEQRDDLSRFAPVGANWIEIDGIVSHVFTHFSLSLDVLHAIVPLSTSQQIAESNSNYRWVHHTELDNEALPSVMRKVVHHALQSEQIRGVDV